MGLMILQSFGSWSKASSWSLPSPQSWCPVTSGSFPGRAIFLCLACFPHRCGSWAGGLQEQTLCSGTEFKSRLISYWQDDFGQVASLGALVSVCESEMLMLLVGGED